MKIYIIRHGQTFFNLVGRVQGVCDSPLTQLGIDQAIAVGKSLKNVDFVSAYSSTSERAIDTANYIIGDRKIKLTPLKGLKEMNFGSLEAEYEKDVLAPDGSSHNKGFVEFGGENRQMVQDRMISTLMKIAKDNPSGNVLVVSHGGAIMNALIGVDREKVEAYRNEGRHIENCSVSIIEFIENKFYLNIFSDISYREKKGVKLNDI